MSGASLQLALRQLSKCKEIDFGDSRYAPELRAFALTLNFYSAKAYNIVRETFDMCWPHPKSLSKWYRSVNGNPGFSAEALEAVTKRSESLGAVLCAVVVDEMAIRRQVEWDGNSYVGFVDIGADVDDDSLPVAKEALVFMAVSVNERWKVPFGYFLFDGLNADERANLLSTCVSKLYECHAHVLSVTFDGSSSNLAMVKKLGCKLNSLTPTTTFAHPADNTRQIAVLLDPCHMLKLMRNMLADKGFLIDENGDEVRWEYVVKLEQLQSREGLRAGNRLTQRHINWTKQKMKVNFAAQTLSSSAADALEFCRDDLGLSNFENCAGTVRFIRLINRALDSRNLLAKGYKSPLRVTNEGFWRPFVNEARSYLWELRLSSGERVCESNRKTGVIGLITCLTSLCFLFDKLVSCPSAALAYLLTDKFSQDHIELFFCAVRRRGGWNNNPTVRQFKTAFKRLLLYHQVKAVASGNCVQQEHVNLLTVSSRIETAHSIVYL